MLRRCSSVASFCLIAAAATCILLLVQLSAVSAQQLGSAVELMMSFVPSRTDTSIAGAVTQTVSKNKGIISALSKTWTRDGSTTLGNKPINVDSCMRMGRMSEVLVSYAAVKLFSMISFAKSLDSEIDSLFMPNFVKAIKPGTTATSITYKMLMMHTSTITDSNVFEASTVLFPAAVGTLSAFVIDFFVSSGSLRGAVFKSGTPGSASAYDPARANTALLSFVLEQIISQKSQPYEGLKDFIAREVLAPFGMSSTFWLETTGATPGVTPTPTFTGTYTGTGLKSTTVYAQYFDGCILDGKTSGLKLHPAWSADYMGYTTVGDISRLAHGLLISTASLATTLPLQEKIGLDSKVTSLMRQGQNGQGLGLMYYDGDVICAKGRVTNVISSCPLTNASKIIGFASSSGPTSVGFLCTVATPSATDAVSAATGTSNTVCVATGIIAATDRSSLDSVFAFSAAVMQESFGSNALIAVTTMSPSGVSRSLGEENLYGIEVLMGSFFTWVAVILLTVFVQMLLVPVAAATITDTAAQGDVDIVRSPGQNK